MEYPVGRFTFGFYMQNGLPFKEGEYPEYVDNAINEYHTKGRDLEERALKEYEIEKSEPFHIQESRARQFMSVFGLTKLPEVHLIGEDPDDTFEFLDIPTTLAMVPEYLDSIVVREMRLREEDMYNIPHAIAKILVHEFAHASIDHDYVGIQADSALKKGRFHGRAGFMVRDVDDWQGSFFEEGFAEYMASRYVRTLRGDMRVIGFDTVPELKLPSYHRPPDANMLSGLDGYAMELLAYTCDKKGILDKDTFVELLVDTRRREIQAPAFRAFACAIDSIEPGLYTRLRRLEHGKENWALACSYVHHLAVQA